MGEESDVLPLRGLASDVSNGIEGRPDEAERTRRGGIVRPVQMGCLRLIGKSRHGEAGPDVDNLTVADRLNEGSFRRVAAPGSISRVERHLSRITNDPSIHIAPNQDQMVGEAGA